MVIRNNLQSLHSLVHAHVHNLTQLNVQGKNSNFYNNIKKIKFMFIKSDFLIIMHANLRIDGTDNLERTRIEKYFVFPCISIHLLLILIHFWLEF